MTNAQEIYRKQLLARIHTNPQYKIIKQNDAWQDWLNLRFGVESSKELSIKELNKILDILNNKCSDELNFKPDRVGRNIIIKDKISAKQSTKIQALADKLEWSNITLFRFCAKQTGKYIISILALNKSEATKVITGLNAVLKDKAKNLECEKN